jgi:hemerythrin-like domain-containing protein
METQMARSTSRTSFPEPMTMLIQDHRKVQKMFKQFEKLKDQDDEQSKRDLVEQTCAELKVHTQIEEEIFYPAAREGLEEDDLVAEALVEHDSAKRLIAKLEGANTPGEEYDALFTVLGEHVNHHIAEEQDEMFPKLKKADLDWVALALQMQERKQQLQEELGLGQEEEEELRDEEPASVRRTGREAAGRSRRSATSK